MIDGRQVEDFAAVHGKECLATVIIAACTPQHYASQGSACAQRLEMLLCVFHGVASRGLGLHLGANIFSAPGGDAGGNFDRRREFARLHLSPQRGNRKWDDERDQLRFAGEPGFRQPADQCISDSFMLQPASVGCLAIFVVVLHLFHLVL
jgi:hypothetical protein